MFWVLHKMAYNCLQLTEVGDYEAQNFKLKQMLVGVSCIYVVIGS